ncbi:Sarcosine oxidase gamma subunit [Marinobacterium lacunae]|uniref:Sarcosine oxidase gamma subunit n=1 Tax=Marinobacterium lacunae TaxID=1232683 RepID=A0A081G062_9GAMM|nr:hypothetical protein [Marinobacterium lacunae]KEA64167.1 Sarcosine oxidase gamma subunit [Marinobacterium lacunae]MBR9882554.1 hypothetical protein [Oceanospirillales bacterium]
MTALHLSNRDDLRGYLLTGPGSADALSAAGLPLPQAQLSAAASAEALVARTGSDEYMAFIGAGAQQPAHEWCFPRADSVLALKGEGWIALMAQVCQYDFRRMQPGDWLMTSVAGVNCWLYHEINGALLIGFDSGYDHYMNELFHTLVNELGGHTLNEGDAR